MFALRILGHSWYQSHSPAGIASCQDLQKATIYSTRDAAEEDAILLGAAWPSTLSKLVVKRLRKVRIQRRTSRVVEWKTVMRGGVKAPAPARTTIDCEWVMRYVVKR